MEKKKSSGPVSEINVTPMVDVMLVMLIIFMVITPMLTKGIPVDLVRTRNPVAMHDADKDDAVLVAVGRDGKCYLGSTPLPADQLPGKVKDLLTNRLNKTVYLKCDSRARFEKVVEVVDNLRAGGVDQLGLLTDQIEQTRKAAAAPPPGI